LVHRTLEKQASFIPGNHAPERQQAGLAKLASVEGQDAGLQIDIGDIEGKRLADSEL
jgi:hypothetical protein